LSTDDKTPRPVLLADYRPFPYLVDDVDLRIDLFADHALVRCRLRLRCNPEASAGGGPSPGVPEAAAPTGAVLALDGEELELLELRLDGVEPAPERYRIVGERKAAAAGPEPAGLKQPCRLLLADPPPEFTLETVSRIFPAANTALEGLYRSGAMFCTQCEPEGFRRITWYPDRPDVSAPFTVTISADRESCPVLLAGGNPLDRGEFPGGRHWASFRDPFPKPAYLFALVAGDLVGIHDRFITAAGREIVLAIYVEAHNRDKCAHAMAALQKAMRWDEETFGLEYDLDHYLIVAADDFNMGAMENKGLNIFNARYVLARPESATDDDFEQIEAVIAHEYFHNWTGNRVTCRDWFQLSLKEGLTVFREQLFCQAFHSPGVKRIQDVRLLRENQFAEDAGPLAHPVRPQSYLEINNFYTLTVYEKGAELVRMLHTLLGPAAFRRGLCHYLERHDGGAATIEDFLAAMAAAGQRDLGCFARWYEQAGTPLLRVRDDYQAAGGRYTLAVEQSLPPLPGSAPPAPAAPSPPPLHIPLVLGLLAPDGREISAHLLELTEPQTTFVFEELPVRPVPSLLRGFSAPVRLAYDYDDEQLRLLLTHDSDPFCRWEAGQRLSGKLLLDLAGRWRQGEEIRLSPDFIELYRQLLADAASQEDKSFAALLLALPAEDYLAEQMTVIDVEAIHAARESFRRQLAAALRPQWLALYEENRAAAGRPGSAGQAEQYDSGRAGCRRLQNLALAFLLALADNEVFALARRQFAAADNMTDSLAALKALVHAAAPAAPAALAEFAARWGADALVMDKWFSVQATAPRPATLAVVRELMKHPAFRLENPNRVRALIGAFAGANPVAFHQAGGAGYRFLAEQVLALDPRNPQIAARLAARLSRWRRYDQERQELMRRELARILAAPGLSRDVYEVASKSL
jgi:aminopeptidase N